LINTGWIPFLALLLCGLCHSFGFCSTWLLPAPSFFACCRCHCAEPHLFYLHACDGNGDAANVASFMTPWQKNEHTPQGRGLRGGRTGVQPR